MVKGNVKRQINKRAQRELHIQHLAVADLGKRLQFLVDAGGTSKLTLI